jgi:2-iminobutanoate/2-iminopropanoate deaminase
MRGKTVFSPGAPEPVGPYSQAIDTGSMIFISGQIPLDPDSGEIVGTTAAEQAGRVLKNIAAILSACGLGLHSVVKTTVYLRSMDDFAAVNAVYDEMFNGWKPARAVIEAAALPKNVLVEIEAVACR